jgi:hypothetical protein
LHLCALNKENYFRDAFFVKKLKETLIKTLALIIWIVIIICPYDEFSFNSKFTVEFELSTQQSNACYISLLNFLWSGESRKSRA